MLLIVSYVLFGIATLLLLLFTVALLAVDEEKGEQANYKRCRYVMALCMMLYLGSALAKFLGT